MVGVTERVVALRCLARAQGQASMTVGCVSSVLLLLHAWLRADLLTVFYSRHHAPLQTHCLTLGQTQRHSADPSPCETLPGCAQAPRRTLRCACETTISCPIQPIISRTHLTTVHVVLYHMVRRAYSILSRIRDAVHTPACVTCYILHTL